MSAAFFIRDVATYKPRNVAQGYIVKAVEKLQSLTLESKEDLESLEFYMKDICDTATDKYPNCLPSVVDKQIDCTTSDILYSIHGHVTTRSMPIANIVICRVRGSWAKGGVL